MFFVKSTQNIIQIHLVIKTRLSSVKNNSYVRLFCKNSQELSTVNYFCKKVLIGVLQGP